MAKCKECKGAGVVDYLVSMHDDVTETSTCNRCNGKGSINHMSDEDEADYHADWW